MAHNLPSNNVLLIVLVIVLPSNLLYQAQENSQNRLWFINLCWPTLGLWDLEDRTNLRVKSVVLQLGSLPLLQWVLLLQASS